MVATLLSLVLFGVEIPESAKVKNRGNYCTWACLDTAARVNNCKPLQGVFIRRSLWHNFQPGYDNVIEEVLQEAGVKYKLFKQLSYDRSLLEQYTNSHGVVISFIQGTPQMGCHTVYVTHYDNTTVKFWDPNRPAKVLTCSRQWFDTYWLGSSVVVFPDEEQQK